MYCELKDNQYWVWSSRIASLDCLPQFKFNTLDELNLHYGELSIKKKKVSKNVFRAKNMRQSKAELTRKQKLLLWAKSLN